jgi:hypothetical protein
MHIEILRQETTRKTKTQVGDHQNGSWSGRM